jgi:hypothetical protein
VKPLLSGEHFSVDSTRIQAWASIESFRRKDGQDEPPSAGRNGERDLHEEKRSNETHASTTDPGARLYKKGQGKEAKLSFIGHLLMENKNGLIIDARPTRAASNAEPEAALAMLDDLPGGRVTVVSRLEHRCADHAPSRLPDQPDHPKADRGSQRLDQRGRRHGSRGTAIGPEHVTRGRIVKRRPGGG